MMMFAVLLWMLFFLSCVRLAGAPVHHMWPVLIPLAWLYALVIREIRGPAPVQLTWEKMKELRDLSIYSGPCETEMFHTLTMWRWEARNVGLFNWTERELAMGCMHPLKFIGKKRGVDCYLPMYIPGDSCCNTDGNRATLDP